MITWKKKRTVGLDSNKYRIRQDKHELATLFMGLSNKVSWVHACPVLFAHIGVTRKGKIVIHLNVAQATKETHMGFIEGAPRSWGKIRPGLGLEPGTNAFLGWSLCHELIRRLADHSMRLNQSTTRRTGTQNMANQLCFVASCHICVARSYKAQDHNLSLSWYFLHLTRFRTTDLT